MIRISFFIIVLVSFISCSATKKNNTSSIVPPTMTQAHYLFITQQHTALKTLLKEQTETEKANAKKSPSIPNKSNSTSPIKQDPYSKFFNLYQ